MKKMSPTKRIRKLNKFIDRFGWFIAEPVEDDLWCLYSSGGYFLCWFELSKTHDTLKHWLLLGLTLENDVELGNLPNWEKYKDLVPASWQAPRNPPENYFSMIKRSDHIRLYAPTRLIKRIKPIEETK